MIRVQIADDHELILKGIQATLQDQTDIQVVAPLIQSGTGLLQKIETAKADVLLMDLRMPDFDAFIALEQLAARGPRPRVIVLTAQHDSLLVQAAADRGAAGYILKDEALTAQLPAAIRDVAHGRKWFSPRASQHLLTRDSRDALSAQQRDVLRLMASGKTPDEIAKALHRQPTLIYKVQEHIRDKLGVETNEQAILLALRERLVPVVFD